MRTTIGRRQPDPVPFTWEIPTALGLCWVSVAGATLLLAQAVAGVLSGHGWLWPDSAVLLPAVGGLLTGHLGVGVQPTGGLPAAGVVYAVAVGLGAGLVAGTVYAGTRYWGTFGQGRRTGMATRAEVQAVLGAGRLHRVRHLVRPDLYGPPPRAGHRVLGLRARRWRAGEAVLRRRTRFAPQTVGWRLGTSSLPRTGPLWVPYDRTTGVYGPQGSGKTLDLLVPALLGAPGAALVTLTKVEDLLLSVTDRSAGGRPVAVLDPFGSAPGLPQLVWDPVAGCVDSMVAERRAKAFTAGTVKGAVAAGTGDSAARFYAAEGAKVLQAYFHAAALTGRTVEDVLEWVASPRQAALPEEILATHPHAAPFWHGLLHGALHGDERTAGNTTTTVQQAMGLFFQQSLRARCTPGPGRPATNLADLIARRGTVYLLGRDDPYASASPLMTAVAEHVLDTALAAATASPSGRLCPPLLACLDELPSTAPLPTLRTRMANERALGISFLYAAQTWRQLVLCYGQDEARALFGLTNVIAVFGGGKDGAFNRELSQLLGTSRVSRTTYQRGRGSGSASYAGADEPTVRPEEVRLLPERYALLVAENAKPLLVKLSRCVDGKPGRVLLGKQAAAARQVSVARAGQATVDVRTAAALDAATRMDLHPAPATKPQSWMPSAGEQRPW